MKRQLIVCLFFLSSNYFITSFAEDNISFPVTNTPSTFLAISDMHYDNTAKNINYGQDTGIVLWNNTKIQIKTLLLSKNPPKFIVLLGDLPKHGTLNSARANNAKAVLQDLDALVKLFNVPIFYVPGNNDSLMGDYHSFTNDNGQNVYALDPNGSWPALNSNANCDNSPEKACVIDDKNINKGYYAIMPLGTHHKLRLIILNSVIFSGKYQSHNVIDQEEAADDELTWFKSDLSDAKKNKEQVLIAMHIPPGLDAWSGKEMWSKKLNFHHITVVDRFLNDIKTYKKHIIGILTSHTHRDEIRKLYDSSGDFVALAVSTPSISVIRSNNPSIKLFYYDNSNYSLLYTETYYATTPNGEDWDKNKYLFSGEYN